VKLDRKRVIGVSMGSSRMMDECDVTFLSNFFHDAARHTFKKGFKKKINTLALCHKIILKLKHAKMNIQ